MSMKNQEKQSLHNYVKLSMLLNTYERRVNYAVFDFCCEKRSELTVTALFKVPVGTAKCSALLMWLRRVHLHVLQFNNRTRSVDVYLPQ
jgi:hypothetical protein